VLGCLARRGPGLGQLAVSFGPRATPKHATGLRAPPQDRASVVAPPVRLSFSTVRSFLVEGQGARTSSTVRRLTPTSTRPLLRPTGLSISA
jgi:hypothetical protein